jgi:hypothetical protein
MDSSSKCITCRRFFNVQCQDPNDDIEKCLASNDDLKKELIAWEYQQACRFESNINEHLPILHAYASKCRHLTEFGIQYGWSTRALLASFPETLVSVEIRPIRPYVLGLREWVEPDVTTWKIINDDTLQIEIDETDFLLIDSLHQYEHLKKELELHADKVRHYIAFHDTVTFGSIDEGSRKPLGIRKAILEFLADNTNWNVEVEYQNNNGLIILRRNPLT